MLLGEEGWNLSLGLQKKQLNIFMLSVTLKSYCLTDYMTD